MAFPRISVNGVEYVERAAFDALLEAAQKLDDAFNWLLDDVAVSYADAFTFRAAIESAKKAVEGQDAEA